MSEERWNEFQKDFEKEIYAVETTLKTLKEMSLTEIAKHFISVYETIVKLMKLTFTLIINQGKETDKLREDVNALARDIKGLRRRLDEWEAQR